MFRLLALLLFSPALAFAQDPYQTDLVDQYRVDPYQAAGSYQEGPYQEPYKVPTHYQTKKKQIVSYTADHENGYQAEVRYEGEARPEVPQPNDYLGPKVKCGCGNIQSTPNSHM